MKTDKLDGEGKSRDRDFRMPEIPGTGCFVICEACVINGSSLWLMPVLALKSMLSNHAVNIILPLAG